MRWMFVLVVFECGGFRFGCAFFSVMMAIQVSLKSSCSRFLVFFFFQVFVTHQIWFLSQHRIDFFFCGVESDICSSISWVVSPIELDGSSVCICGGVDAFWKEFDRWGECRFPMCIWMMTFSDVFPWETKFLSWWSFVSGNEIESFREIAFKERKASVLIRALMPSIWSKVSVASKFRWSSESGDSIKQRIYEYCAVEVGILDARVVSE